MTVAALALVRLLSGPASVDAGAVAAVPVAARPVEASSATPVTMSLELTAGARALFRELTYASDPADALTPFGTAIPAPALSLGFTWLAHWRSLRLGLELEAERAAPLRAKTSRGSSYRTSTGDTYGGAILGWTLGGATVDLALGAGAHRYSVTSEGAAASQPRLVPSVDYRYLRAGPAVRLTVAGATAVRAGVHYRQVLRAGEIASRAWFPGMTVFGVEADLGLEYRWSRAWATSLAIDLRLYDQKMSPLPGDAHVTDGGRDLHLGLALAVSWTRGAPR
jgi:hypothetical protein